MRSGSVYYRCASLRDVTGTLPADLQDWLHPGELRHFAMLADHRRQDQWLGGRWLAKHIIQRAVRPAVLDLRCLWIRSRDPAGRSVRPEVLLQDHLQPWSLSIAHTDGGVIASLTLSPEISLGIDLVERRPLSTALQRAWFTETEEAWLRQSDPLEAATVWALKEAIYKALQRGEGFAPRKIEVRRLPAGSYAGTYNDVCLDDVCRLHVWEPEGHVAALAVGCESARTKVRQVPV